MILDLICLQVAFFLAYTLRHRTVNLYTNYIYANLSIVLILIDVCLLIFLNTLKNVLKRGYLVEFIATIKHVAIVELVAVLYLFSVKDAGNFSRITFFLMALFYGLLTYGTRLLWKKHILRTLHLKQNKSVLVITNFDRLSQETCQRIIQRKLQGFLWLQQVIMWWNISAGNGWMKYL